MIRCSKSTLKFSNTAKLEELHSFLDEYQKVMESSVDLLWEQDKVFRFIPKDTTDKLDSWLSQRAIQCAAKQASGVVRGTRKKQEQRIFQHKELVKQGKFKQARRLKKYIDKAKVSKPDTTSLNAELDSRFVKLDWDNSTSFDGWLTLTSLGNKLKIKLPVKKNKPFNWMSVKGTLKAGVRISKEEVTFNFELPDVEKKKSGSTLGIDIGSTTTLSCSNDYQSKEDKHGWDLSKIQDRLKRRKKGSKGFSKAQTLRTNYVNWTVNKLNLSSVKKIRIERFKGFRKGRRSSRKLSHWTYTTIFDKLEDICSTTGVQIEQVNPTYTSQRCSRCGWVRKRNRRGKKFKCKACSFECDADLNAARNIALEGLPAISKSQRLLRANRKGFYWHEVVQECIVPEA